MLNTTQKRSKSIVIVFGNIRFSLDPRIGLVQMHFLEQFYFANRKILLHYRKNNQFTPFSWLVHRTVHRYDRNVKNNNERNEQTCFKTHVYKYNSKTAIVFIPKNRLAIFQWNNIRLTKRLNTTRITHVRVLACCMRIRAHVFHVILLKHPTALVFPRPYEM